MSNSFSKYYKLNKLDSIFFKLTYKNNAFRMWVKERNYIERKANIWANKNNREYIIQELQKLKEFLNKSSLQLSIISNFKDKWDLYYFDFNTINKDDSDFIFVVIKIYFTSLIENIENLIYSEEGKIKFSKQLIFILRYIVKVLKIVEDKLRKLNQ